MSKLKARSLRSKTEVYARNEDGEFESIEVNTDGELKTDGFKKSDLPLINGEVRVDSLKPSDLSFNSEGALEVTGISGGGGSSYEGVYNRVFNESVTGLSDSSQVFDIGSIKTINGVFNLISNNHTQATIRIEASIGLVGTDYNWFDVINQIDNGELIEFDFTARYYKYTITFIASSNTIVSEFSIVLREEAVVEISNFPLTAEGKLDVDVGELDITANVEGFTFKETQLLTFDHETYDAFIDFDTYTSVRVKFNAISINRNGIVNSLFGGLYVGNIDDGDHGYSYTVIPINDGHGTKFYLEEGEGFEVTTRGNRLYFTFGQNSIAEGQSMTLRVDINEIVEIENRDLTYTSNALNVNVVNQSSNSNSLLPTIPRENFIYQRLRNSSNVFDITSNYSSSNSTFRYVVPAGKRFVWTKVRFLIFDESWGLGEGFNVSNGLSLRMGTLEVYNFRLSSEIQTFFREIQEARTSADNNQYFYEHSFNPPLVLQTAEQPNILVRDDLSNYSAWQWLCEGYLIDGDV